jgi:hypothetical protein
MELVKDILTDDTGDLVIESGDFKVAESDYHHIRDIMIAAPGHYKQSPLVGANIRMEVNGAIDGNFRRELRLQLQADGFNVKQIKEVNGILDVDAERI